MLRSNHLILLRLGLSVFKNDIYTFLDKGAMIKPSFPLNVEGKVFFEEVRRVVTMYYECY